MIARLLSLLVVVCVLQSTTADAQRRYRTVLREALSEFERGNYAEARTLFMEAYELEPSARVLRGAGMSAFEERQYVLSYRLMRQALDHSEGALNGEQRAEAEALIERALTFIGRFRVQTDPADARMTVDVRPAELEDDGTLLLDIGPHALSLSADGYETLERRLRVQGGEDETLELELVLEGGSAAFQAPEARAKSLDGLGLSLLVGGGAFVLAGIGTLAWWINRGGEVGLCEDAIAAGNNCLNLSTLEGQRTGPAPSPILLLVGGATALLTGLLRYGRSDDRAVPIACGIGREGGGCSYRTTF